MKPIFFLLSFLSFTSFFVNLSSLEAKGGQGIAYYNAGFPQVAKPILQEELTSDPTNTAENCFYLGNIYFGENLLDSATYFFNKGLSADPINALNTVGLSMIKMKSNPAEADIDIKNLLKLKDNKKNIDVHLAIAKAYLANKLINQAIEYQEKAQKLKPKYAPVYVLMGDINLAIDSTGKACSNYEMAIYYDENCKEAYIKYARAYKTVNTPLSIEKLEMLKVKEPTFLLVDKELADIYYTINKFDKAAELYENYLHSGNSSAADLTKYAMTLFFNQNFEKSLEIANLGLIKTPRSPAFNRLALYNYVGLKKNDDAIQAADRLFNKSDKADFTYFDYTYYGQALRATKQFDLAVGQYEKAYSLDTTKIDLLKDISDMYGEKGDYNNAILSYNKYVSKISAEKKNADVIMNLGKLYTSLGSSQSTLPEEKLIAYAKADTLFSQVATLEPLSYRGNYWRARINSALDPETTKGLAKPYYELTATLIESKSDAARYNSILIECYSYLGYYSLLQKDNVLSLIYWNKILVIDATNATAIKAIAGITKAMKGKK
ncbi:MAG: hypothetical protein WCJ61_01615 [Paludibacter sp.]